MESYPFRGDRPQDEQREPLVTSLVEPAQEEEGVEKVRAATRRRRRRTTTASASTGTRRKSTRRKSTGGR